MAELREGVKYTMSREQRAPRISVLPIRMTESAMRALEEYRSGKDCVSSQPSIQFQGSQGLIKIPKVDQSNEMNTFNFLVSNIGKDNSQGSFDLFQQKASGSGLSQLSCLGSIQNKITVCATSDSHVKTRERMAQAEAEARSRSAKFIKPGGPFLGRRLPVKRGPEGIPDFVPVRKRSTPMNPANMIRKTRTVTAVSQRPYRDRVIHLLALKNYKKPELLARLQKDGVNQKDKNSLGIILQQVANLNPKDNTFSLKGYLFKEIQKDWPGYSEIDKQSLELILSRKLNPSENATSTSNSESSVTSNTSAPSTSQKPLLSYKFFDPLINEMQRVSHLNSQVQPACSGHLQASSEKAATAHPLLITPAATTPPPPQPLLSTYNLPQTISSSSPSTSDGRGTNNLLVDSFSQNYSSICENQQQKYTSQTPLGTQAPAVVRVKSLKSAREKYAIWYQNPEKVKKQKDKSKMQDTGSVSKKEKDIRKEETVKLEESFCLDSGVQETLTASTYPPFPTTEQPDYLTKYTAIISKEQCESYKEDFYAEYGEYRILHAWIESITKRFMRFDEQQKHLPPGSKKYQVLHEEVIEEYQALAQSHPSYHEQKRRCEYLHSKLSHIKRLIVEFDELKPNDDN
ncbi:RNA polymerase II elongation factor ELL2 [Pezoporus wallicus]|uniref:RNA polymerase II elongation factor ELL2 n=1 Tax=Pezoporus wallicus TaxID=35540 RepID=UPI00254A560D|nr:RNA polymerase II elongation factor ELL2 [Pezoporus wallicus]XP_061301297.1 RNA polymerase II elongation factor ELL2 [Pezoporus flaviventris]